MTKLMSSGRARRAVGPSSGRIDLRPVLCCPMCRGHLSSISDTESNDGILRDGMLVCENCNKPVCTVAGYKFDFLRPPLAIGAKHDVRTVAPEGELRLPAADERISRNGGWQIADSFVWTEGGNGEVIEYRGEFTAAAVRFLKHPFGGVAEIRCNGRVVQRVDLYQPEGSITVSVPVISDLPAAAHHIEIRATGERAKGAYASQIFVHSIVLRGPLSLLGFSTRSAENWGNPYSTWLMEYLDKAPGDAMILEIGGGDRRTTNPRHVNLEYLPYELADIFADIHTLPFADASFDIVFSQAVFEHVREPKKAAAELMRIVKPGGLILTEVAFLQPLHAVPYHFFNMTLDGTKSLFDGCKIIDEGWFGDFSGTITWMADVSGVRERISPDAWEEVQSTLDTLDAHLDHQGAKSIASGVRVAVRKPALDAVDVLEENSPQPSLRFSVVICTDGRAHSLRNTLESLRFLDYARFEVCVVHGPTADGTRELLVEYAGRVKVAACPQRNLSMARNIGIALAAGEIVAFIDDDGLAEPEWLDHLEAAFLDPSVGGAGGVVYDHTGSSPQYWYSSANRLGRADWARATPADEFNFPFSFNIPYVQGTNSAFRRDALIAIGGFDEEIEFYLDETDVCCRMVDAGYQIRQLPNAVVHHKFLPSAIRNENRVTRNLYPIIKNKIYFSLVNNRGHCSLDQVIRDGLDFIEAHEKDLRLHVENSRLLPEDLDTYRNDVERAWKIGLARGLSGERRLLSEQTLHDFATDFLVYPRPQPADGRRTFVYISQEYPPGRMGGIGRFVHQLALSGAAAGHHIHVLTRGEGHDRVDFEDGVWVHRLIASAEVGSPPAGLTVPVQIWANAATMAAALNEIAAKRHITAVCAPIWDCEGIASLIEGRFPVVTSLQTTLRNWLASKNELAGNSTFMKEFGDPMLALEAHVMLESDGIFAISRAIVEEIERGYGIQMRRDRLAVIPLGLDDWTELEADPPQAVPKDSLRLLFVGRLEERKGIDILFEAAKRVLGRYGNVYLDIAGNDQIPGPDGVSWRARFEKDTQADSIRERVIFHGEVTEAQLRGLYNACDILVAPSRFESFGLMLVEGMMFGKPVIGCRAGGMVEVVEEGVTGLLAEPGDVASLEACLVRLIEEAQLRQQFGSAGRARYERSFTAERMTGEVNAFLHRVGEAWHSAHGSVTL
jgi:glycogen(starch) synthase